MFVFAVRKQVKNDFSWTFVWLSFVASFFICRLIGRKKKKNTAQSKDTGALSFSTFLQSKIAQFVRNICCFRYPLLICPQRSSAVTYCREWVTDRNCLHRFSPTVCATSQWLDIASEETVIMIIFSLLSTVEKTNRLPYQLGSHHTARVSVYSSSVA